MAELAGEYFTLFESLGLEDGVVVARGVGLGGLRRGITGGVWEDICVGSRGEIFWVVFVPGEVVKWLCWGGLAD